MSLTKTRVWLLFLSGIVYRLTVARVMLRITRNIAAKRRIFVPERFANHVAYSLELAT